MALNVLIYTICFGLSIVKSDSKIYWLNDSEEEHCDMQLKMMFLREDCDILLKISNKVYSLILCGSIYINALLELFNSSFIYCKSVLYSKTKLTGLLR